MSSLPPATSVLKPMAKYLQQAKQLEKVEPVMAYYCRLFALQMGMKIGNKSKDDLKLISSQMEWLESHRSLISSLSKEDGRSRAETFALQVFQHGDDEDRAGLATKKTAINFHAAYVLMDVCRQFSTTGDLPFDLEEKQRYAIVKAADINKAIKEGRKPKAGPLNEPTADEQNAEDEALLATLGGSPAASASASSPGVHFGTAAAPFPNSHSTSAPPSSSSAASSPWPAQSPSQSSFNAYAPSASAYPASAPHPAVSPLPHAGYNSNSFISEPPNPTPLPNAPAYDAPHFNLPNPAPFTQPTPTSAPPPAGPTPAPAAPAARLSPFSPEAIAARNAPGRASSAAFSKKDTKKMDAVRDSERLIKHALSACAFADIHTTVLKLQEALQLLQPFDQ